MFKKVLIANRGAVAARIIRALKKLGILSVAVYSEADAAAPYLKEADEALLIGPGPAKESYLNQDALFKAIKDSGADAVHPGYGFLSENAGFARALESRGVAFIGPSPDWLEKMGDKVESRKLMAEYGVPMLVASPLLPDDEAAIVAEGERIGFPLLIKATGGGGGIGMQPVTEPKKLVKAVGRARALAERTFSNDGVYLEKLLERPRHIEFQVVADKHGNACTVFERDCSVQRRYQKVIEESPAPAVDEKSLSDLADTICKAVQTMGYDNIGTVEMLRGEDGSFTFLEMNTRLQVEHGVTEEVTGVDLVVAQIRSAAGDRLSDIFETEPESKGHAVQARVYAEDPIKFFPSPGHLDSFRPPAGEGIRVETGYAEGMDVTPFYDPMIAKVIAKAADRKTAISRLRDALAAFSISGPKTNIPFLLEVLDSEEFQSGQVHTGLAIDLRS
jgi:acetyl-CoA carboxylase, biotin carboxylase subunit